MHLIKQLLLFPFASSLSLLHRLKPEGDELLTHNWCRRESFKSLQLKDIFEQLSPAGTNCFDSFGTLLEASLRSLRLSVRTFLH